MKVHDLTREIKNNMPAYSKEELPCIKPLFSSEKDGFNVTELKLTSHIGTHIDVPFHIFEKGKNILDFSAEKFMGKGMCISFEKLNTVDFKNLKEIDFILIYTGWEKYWEDERYFKGYPVIDDEILEKIINSNIKGIGMDCISPDEYGSEDMKIHKKLLQNEKIIIENLCGLENILNKTFFFSCLPLKVKSDGCPIRAVAVEK